MARLATTWLSVLVAIGCTAQGVPPTLGPTAPTDAPSTSSTPSAATPSHPALATPSPTSQSTAASTVILRLTVYEAPSPATTREPPEFSLYSTGQVVYVLKVADRGFELRQARLDEAQMDGLIRAATAPLRDARVSYEEDADGAEYSRTAFDIRTPQLTKFVWVYALGEADDHLPTADDRARLRPLRERLLNFDRDVQAAMAGDLGRYEPEHYLVELYNAPAELPDKIDWPWQALDIDDFARRDFSRVMPASELDAVLPVADSEFLITRAPNGGRYVIYLTPLLPGDPTV